MLTVNMARKGELGFVIVVGSTAAMQVAICAMIDCVWPTYMFNVACYNMKCLNRIDWYC